MAISPSPAIPAGSAPAVPGTVVDLPRSIETGAQRVQRLQHEARLLAREQAEALADDLLALAARMAEVAGGGEAYSAGVRELASRMADDLPQKANLIQAIMARSGHH
jgi:CRISPR/Cas system-associated protein Csm6